MKRIILVTTVILFTITIGCKKDDDDIAASKKEILINGSWKINAAVSDEDGDGTYETNNYLDFDACSTDDYYIFHNDGKLEINEGPSKCDLSDPQTISLNWQLANNETILIVDSEAHTIETLNNTTLKIKYSIMGMNSLTTFTKR